MTTRGFCSNLCRTKQKPYPSSPLNTSAEIIVTLRGDEVHCEGADKLTIYLESGTTTKASELGQRGDLGETSESYETSEVVSSEPSSHRDTFPVTEPVFYEMEPTEQHIEVPAGSSKDIMNSDLVEQTQDEMVGLEDVQSLKNMGPTKYVKAHIDKESKKLLKMDKSLATQTHKLQKTRNSLSKDAGEKKHEKMVKQIAKTAEIIGVMEIEKNQQEAKIAKLKEMMADRKSIICVVRRKSTCEAKMLAQVNSPNIVQGSNKNLSQVNVATA